MRLFSQRGSALAPVNAVPQLDVRYAKRIRSLDMVPPSLVEQVMGTPPTIGSLTTTTSIASPKRWPSVTYASGQSQLTDYFETTGATSPVIHTTASPGNNYVRYTSLQNQTSAGLTKFAAWNQSFYHDGTQVELRLLQASGLGVRVWVDGQLAQSAPVMFGTTPNSDGYVLLTFATRGVRKIRVESNGGTWGGVVTPMTDSVWKADEGGPVCVVVTDSFGEGANGVGHHSAFPRRFARRMNWPRTVASSVGGTGFLNVGVGGYNRVKWRDRITTDILPFAPDIVVWCGSRNDTAYAGQVQAEVTLCLQQVAAAYPSCLQVVTAPTWGPGPRSHFATLIQTRDALKAAAAAVGVPFLDWLEVPTAGLVTTTSSNTTAAAATGISLPVVVPIGSVIHVDNRDEYNIVTGISGGGPFTHTLQYAWARQHNAGAPVVQVGQSLWTGMGNAGTPAGDGNSDFLVSNDAVHPTKEGQDAIGDWLAWAFTKYAVPAA